MITKTNNRTLLAVSGVEYDFDFRIDDATELEVYGITVGGVSTELTTGFSIAFDTANEEGTVTFDAEPSTYAQILMLRNRAYTQDTDIPIRGGFSEEDIEKALDQIVIQIQQLKELTDYSVKQDLTGTPVNIVLPSPEDGRALVWDGTSGAMTNADIEGPKGDTGDTGPQGPAGADGIFSAIASQAEAEAGIENTKGMTALRVAQAIDAQALVFVDRGDPSAYDFVVGALTVDSTWRDMDLSSIVPAGAKAVLLLVEVVNDSANRAFAIRKKGHTAGYNAAYTYSQVASVSYMASAVVACDVNRFIQYYVQNAGTWSAVNILVRGWWI